MKQIDMIMAFAELEGVEINAAIDTMPAFATTKGGSLSIKRYNPITDLALNCAARDKYEVTIDYIHSKVFIDNLDYQDVHKGHMESYSEIVIECILKSKGLWV